MPYKRHPGQRKGWPEPEGDYRTEQLYVQYSVVGNYYDWLLEQVGTSEEQSQQGMLFRRLFAIEFYDFVHNDENRGEDGRALRADFARENGVNRYEELDGPCRVLELLVGLSVRMDMLTGDAEQDIDRRGYWFWILLDNLGLRGLTDSRFLKEGGWSKVDDAVRTFMDRTYAPNGEGGLFPLKHPIGDQREVELWYQMQYYINENWSYKDYKIQ